MSLTDEQIRVFKRQLDRRLQALREEIRQELLESDQAHFIELAGQVYDTGEASVADLLEDVELADVSRHVGAIREIDAALLRIAQGTYGMCIDCGKAIGIERLEAQPAAARCQSCQTRWEEKPSFGGSRRGPSL
jgi:DnaK suppressor protein